MPLDLVFRDETGKLIELGDFFGKKPVILLFVYYEYPNLSPSLSTGAGWVGGLASNISRLISATSLTSSPLASIPAKRFKSLQKTDVIQRYGHPGAAAGWHFLTGEHEPIDRLAQTVGFQYAYEAESEQYAHVPVL